MKVKFLFGIFFLIVFIIPSVNAAFEAYDTEEFGGYASVLSAGSVTTNATTNLSKFGWVTLNGYLGDDGGEICNCWFEWGLDTNYGNSSKTYNYSRDLHIGWNSFLTFPHEIFLYNTTFSTDTSVENFLTVGLTAGNVYTVFRYNSSDGDIDSWRWDHQWPLTYMNSSLEKPYCTYYFNVNSSVDAPLLFEYDAFNGESCEKGDIFNFRIDTLLPNTTYHYRARSQNGFNITNGTDMTFHTPSALYDYPNSSSVEETKASLSARLYYDIGNYTTGGFWVGTSSTSKTSFSFNYTSDDYPVDVQNEFTYDIPIGALTPGEYYYIRSWMKNRYGFWNSTNESYFLTLPEAPTGLTKVNSSYEQIGLRWTNATVGVDNLTTVVVYKTTGYPASIADGTVGYNGTGNNTLITGLSVDTTYYFSAWHYINASGSPFKTAYSSSFATASGDTEGGVYNITVKYEDNRTNVSNAVMAAFVHTCEARLVTGELLNITHPITNPFQMNCTQTPDVMFFDFKDRNLSRAVTPESGARNITFYISSRPEYETDLNVSDCQLWYTFSFNDYTNYFASSHLSKLYIYKYNGTEKYYIHQDYWSAEDTVDAALQYGDRYYLGVWCPTVYIPFLQYFDAHETTDPAITITYEQTVQSNINAYVNINFSWAGGGHGIWVNYTDSDFNTNSVSLYIYQTWKLNGTLVLRNQTNWTTDQKNYRYTQAMGCNNTSIYYIKVVIDHARFTTNQTITSLMYPYSTAITNPYWIEDWFNTTLGEGPFVDTDPDSPTYGHYIEWTHIIAFAACLFLLMTIGHINLPLTMIGVGILLVILEAVIGVVVTRSAGFTTVGILGGVLLIILGVIVAVGGKRE